MRRDRHAAAEFSKRRVRPLAGSGSAWGCRGFTQVELIIAVLVVGLMGVAAMNTVGASRTAEVRHLQLERGLLLAQDLLSEIFPQPYQDLDQPVDLIGPEPSESAPGNRSRFDDVDDYDGWTASPPRYPDGTVIAWASGYQRQVQVQWLNPNSLPSVSNTATGIKRIRVTVRYAGRVLVTLEAIRTNAWLDPLNQ